jgi:hypothetical protein
VAEGERERRTSGTSEGSREKTAEAHDAPKPNTVIRAQGDVMLDRHLSSDGHASEHAQSTPREFIESPREAALAEQVWKLANEMMDPATYHRVIIELESEPSKDWTTPRLREPKPSAPLHHAVTVMRLGKLHGTVNKVLGTSYSAREISNVSHFFDAFGMPSVLLGSNTIAFIVGLGLSTLWDLGVSPLSKLGTMSAKDAFSYDYKQFKDYDLQGLYFGASQKKKP